MDDKIINRFFFAEKSITAQIYLDILIEYVSPQLEQYQPQVIFQQDGAPPHWTLKVYQFLNETFPDRWIGRDGPILWSPRSPDITQLGFFPVGLCKRYRLPNQSQRQKQLIQLL